MKKKTWQKLLAFLLVMMLMVSSLPMTALAAELQQNDDVYSVNMPVTGSDTLDLTDKAAGFTFHVYDDGGADANYSNGCDGTLLITAPENYIFRISGSGNTETNYDWLYLYEGDTTTELGSGKYQGTFTVDEIMTGDNVLKLFFHSDSSKNFSGMDLTVTLIDSATLATLSFLAGEGSGAMNNISVVPGTEVTVPDCGFTLPEDKLFTHYTDGTNDYHPGDVIELNANLTLTAIYANTCVVTYAYETQTQTADIAEGSAISLPTFASLFTLPERKTFQYWLGGETQYAEGDSFTVTGNVTFTAVLTDDPVILHSETYANYALIPKGINVTADLSGEDEGYQLRVFDDGGADANYSNSCNGSITVLAPANCLLGVSGNIVTEGNYDYLWLYDGATTDATQLLKDSGTKTVENVYTNGNALMIRFTSDGSSVKTGLDLTVTVIGSSSTVVLSYDAGEGSGTINSVTVMPGTQVTVPECTFTAPSGKRFSHFTDGTNSYQPGDSVTVSENMTLTAMYINEYTLTYAYGESTKTAIYTEGTQIELPTFASVLTLPERKTFQYWLCGETHYAEGDSFTVTGNVTFTAVFTDDPVILHSEAYENYALLPKGVSLTADISGEAVGYQLRVFDDGGADSNYSDKADGSITVLAPEGCLLGISGDIVTESGYDYLWLYDGATTDAAQLYKDSGTQTISPINTTGTALTIRFSSDGSRNYSGLDLTVTILDQSMLATLSFDAGEGSGTIDDISVNPGSEVSVPECTFTAPNGKRFSHFSDGTNSYQPGDVITLNDDMTLTAIYINEYTLTYTYGESTQTAVYTEGTEINLPTFASMFTLPERHTFNGWRSGETVYDEGDSFTVNSNTTFTAVLTEDPVVQHNDTLGYYAEMPKTVTVTADLSDKADGFVLHVYDDGGADGDYSNSCDGTMLITAPENYILQISGSGVTENYNDYLRIYDGSGSVVLGEELYTDTFTFDTLSTSGNVLKLVFHTDSSRVYSGLDLTVTVKDSSTLATISFLAGDGSGNMNNISVTPGTEVTLPECAFTSPNGKQFVGYSDGTTTYQPGDVITLNENKTLTATYLTTYTVTYSYDGTTHTDTYAEGTEITLPTFTSLFTLPDRYTFKGWQSGNTTYDEEASFTVNANTTFTALLEQEATLLQDDEGNWYTKMPVSGTATVDLTDKADGFTLKVYDNGGSDANYSDYCNGYMVITAPANFVLKISGSGQCESVSYDWLTIYDGDTETVLGSTKYGGRPFTVPELTSSENVLKIFFRSDSGGNYDGLDLTVTLVDYSNYARVTYAFGENTKTVRAENGTSTILPTFTDLFTLPERKVFSAWSYNGATYAEGDSFTVTGDTTFTAVLEDAPVILHGEAGTAYANYANYALLPTSMNVTANLDGWQAGDILWIFDNGGVNGYYSNGCDGSITVIAPAGMRLRVTSDVTTEENSDYLTVYDGNSTTADVLGGPYSGTTTFGSYTNTSLYSTGNAVTIFFHSDGWTNRRGIDMKVTVFDPSSLVRITFDAGEGSGTMDDIVLLRGDSVYLPSCGFTLPEKTYFNYYTDGTNNYYAGYSVTVNADLRLTAVYNEKILYTYTNGLTSIVQEYKKGLYLALPSYTAYGMFSGDVPYRKSFRAWSINGVEHPAGWTSTVNEDTTVTAVFDDLPILQNDASGGVFVTMPRIENVAVDLTEQTNGFAFTLYDNGGASRDYANDCNGSLTFTAPEGFVFAISGSVNTRNYNNTMEDPLYLYDSDGTTLLGESPYCGTVTIEEQITTSNSVKIAFTSDSSATLDGFALTVMMYNPSTRRTLSFAPGEGSGTMDPVTVFSDTPYTLPACGFTKPSGKIFVGWTDGENTYQPGDQHTFTENTTLTALWAESTGVTYSYNGTSKAFEIVKGSTVTLPAFTDLFTLNSGLHFVGWKEKISGEMYSEGDPYVMNDATVFDAVVEILYSDGNGSYYALMPVNNPNDNLTLDLSDKPVGFSFTLYDDGGPENNYADNNAAVLIVHAPENTVLTVTGSGALGYYNDYLRFFNGASWRDGVLGSDRYTDAFAITEPLMTTGNDLYIYFCTNDEYNYEGFELTITVVAPVTVSYVFDGETEVVATQEDATIQLADFDDLFESDTKEFLYWQNGDDTYDPGDDFVVTEDVTFTAVTRLMPTAILDGNGATVKADIGGDGTVTTIGPLPYPTGTTLPLPHANELFDFPEGKYFGGWSCNDRVYAAGEEFTITEDVTLTVIWRDATAWERLNEQLQTASGTIQLTENIAADGGSLPLNVPAGVTVTIDLNGFTLDGTNAATMDGNMLLLYGSLTLTDTAGSGTFTGGTVTAFGEGAFVPNGVGDFAATVTQSYSTSDANYDHTYNTYSVTWYPTFAGAMSAAAAYLDYADSLTLPEGLTFWNYMNPKVTLLQNVTIAEGETLTVDTDNGIELDLNGHSFDVQGTFTGSDWGGDPIWVSIDSTVPGVFRSGGTVGVNLSPWTNDTYYFTDGTMSGFLGADGGTFYISGGHFTDLVMFNNGNDEANLEITLSGDAEFDRLEHMIYGNDGDGPTIHMTISDNVRVGTMVFNIMGDYVVNYPVLTVNGGYFTVDPRTWLGTSGAGEDAVQILATPEQYDSQADWDADTEIYIWRVKKTLFTGHSLSLNGDIGVNFFINLSDEDAQNAVVNFSWIVDEKTKTASVNLASAEKTDYGYKATCNVAPAEMTCNITATVTINGEAQSETDIYSAKKYANVILSDSFAETYTGTGAKSYENLRSLVLNMLSFGAASQNQFGVNTGNPANKDTGYTPAAVNADNIEVTDTDMTADLSNYGLEYTGTTLVCRTTTLMRHYYRIIDQDKFNAVKDSITINGESAEYKEKDGEIYFEISNIAAADLDTDYTLTIGTTEYQYSAMNYVKRALLSASVDDTLKRLTTALYWYNQSANTYFGR